MRTLAAALLIAAGCASPPPVHRALDPDIAFPRRAALRYEPQVRTTVEHQRKKPLNVGTTGLIDGFVNYTAYEMTETANRKREQRAVELGEPLWAATEDFDFPREFETALRSTIAASSWLSLEGAPSDERPGAGKQGFGQPSVLLVRPLHSLDRDGTVLLHATRVNFGVVGEKQDAYFSTLVCFSDPIGTPPGEPAIEAWTADGAARFREAHRAAITETMKMLRLDLLEVGKGAAATGDADTVSFWNPAAYERSKLRGVVLERSADRILLREKGGNLFSIPTSLENYEPGTGGGTR